MRKLTLTGRLAANAETKLTKSGLQFIEFRMANNEYVGGTENNGRDTYWFRVISFNDYHIKMAQHLTKGKSIEVIGTLQVSAYISNVTNKPEVSLEIRADAIMFDDNFSTQQNNGDGNTAVTTPTAPPVAETPVEAAPAPKKTTPRNPTTASKPKAATVTPPSTTATNEEDDLPF